MNNELALEIAQRFRELENENRSLRAVLRQYWTHSTDPEAFVQKGIHQLQVRQREEKVSHALEMTFHASSDDGALLRSLHAEVLRRMTVS